MNLPTSEAPRGHRHHQLQQLLRLLRDHGRPGTLVDVGAGSGWLCDVWATGLAVGLDRYPQRAWTGKPRVVADTMGLPVRGAVADTCTAIAAIGAFPLAGLPDVLGELARVTKPHGTVLLLFSCRSRGYDLLGPHRLVSRFRWTSFDVSEVTGAMEAAGFIVTVVERHGGPATLLAEWLHLLSTPLRRWAWGRRVRTVLGEADRRSLQRHSPRGRYAYVVGRRT